MFVLDSLIRLLLTLAQHKIYLMHTESLSNNGLDFSRCLAFMSDTTNVMKGARSGVQKLIKNKWSHLFDMGCICHLLTLLSKLACKQIQLI